MGMVRCPKCNQLYELEDIVVHGCKKCNSRDFVVNSLYFNCKDTGSNMDILDEVKKVLANKKINEYGDSRECFKLIAEVWSTYLGKEIKIRDVGMLMILLKVIRERYKHKKDNIIDIIGYATLIGRMLGEK